MKKSFKNILMILLIVLAGCSMVYTVSYAKDHITSNEITNVNNNTTLKLASTETNTKIKEGIYITDVSEVVEETMPAIVSITSKTLIQSGYYGPFSFGSNQTQYVEGAGSGIIISNSNDEILILTNNHVVNDSSELTVKFINGKEADAKIVGTSERKDIAIISVKVSDLDSDTLSQIKIATLGDSSELKVGNGIIAIGNALGYGQSVTTGVVSALNREIETNGYTNKMIQIDAAINGGNSGGALLNNKGEVVGINSAKYSSNGSSSEASIEGMGFAIPISDVKDLITDLMNGKEESSGMTLGIEGYMTNSSNISGYNLPVGFYISNITEGGYADKNNLEIGYIITKIDNKEVSSVNDIKNVLYEKKVGDTITLKVKYPSGRTYAEKDIEIKF